MCLGMRSVFFLAWFMIRYLCADIRAVWSPGRHHQGSMRCSSRRDWHGLTGSFSFLFFINIWSLNSNNLSSLMSNLYKNTKVSSKHDKKKTDRTFLCFNSIVSNSTNCFFCTFNCVYKEVWSMFSLRLYAGGWYSSELNLLLQLKYLYAYCYQCMLLIYMINECSEHFWCRL